MSVETQSAGGEAPILRVQPPKEFGTSPGADELRAKLSPAFKSFLASTKLSSAAPSLQQIYHCRSTETVSAVLKRLTDCGVQSLPLLNTETHHYVGFVSVVDIWAWIAQKLNLGQKRPEPELEDIMCTSLIQSTPITAVLAETQHAPFVTMSESCSLQEAIDRMAQSNIHRIAIVDDKNNFRSMVTRSRILSYIDKCYSHVVLGNFSELFVGWDGGALSDFNFGFKDVDCIREEFTVCQAMLKLHRDKVSSVGVVDANNRLIGVISASDIKAIGSTAANYHMLYSQCSTFLDQRGAQAEKLPRLVMITKDAPFSELRDQFFHYGVHRVFIVESEAVPKPCGVVSLHDFMYLFSSGGASQPSSA